MLVETRDTITVPAQIMIRILASLHQYRRLMHSGGELTVSANNHHRQQVAAEQNVEEEEEDEDDDDNAEEEGDEPMDTEEHAVAVVDGVSFDLNVAEVVEEHEEHLEEMELQLDPHINMGQEEEEEEDDEEEENEQQMPVDPLLNNANANDDSDQMSN